PAGFADLRAWDQKYPKRAEALERLYTEDRAANSPELRDRIERLTRRDFAVTLIGEGSPYAPTGAILNRLLVRHLHALDAFTLVRGRVTGIAETPDGRADVTIAAAAAGGPIAGEHL